MRLNGLCQAHFPKLRRIFCGPLRRVALADAFGGETVQWHDTGPNSNRLPQGSSPPAQRKGSPLTPLAQRILQPMQLARPCRKQPSTGLIEAHKPSCPRPQAAPGTNPAWERPPTTSTKNAIPWASYPPCAASRPAVRRRLAEPGDSIVAGFLPCQALLRHGVFPASKPLSFGRQIIESFKVRHYSTSMG